MKRESTWAATAAKRRLTEIEARKKRLVQAYIYDQAIDRPTYDPGSRRVGRGPHLRTTGAKRRRARGLRHGSRLGFARYLLTRAYKLWDTATAGQRRRLQTLIFPEGVTFDGEALGTPVTSLLFSYLGAVETGRERLVAHTGFEPVLPA